ncbi:hypothetical protein LXL04_005505 [Taraxacum kok-saghyz]
MSFIGSKSKPELEIGRAFSQNLELALTHGVPVRVLCPRRRRSLGWNRMEANHVAFTEHERTRELLYAYQWIYAEQNLEEMKKLLKRGKKNNGLNELLLCTRPPAATPSGKFTADKLYGVVAKFASAKLQWPAYAVGKIEFSNVAWHNLPLAIKQEDIKSMQRNQFTSVYFIQCLEMLVQMRTIIKFENGGTNLNRYKSHSLLQRRFQPVIKSTPTHAIRRALFIQKRRREANNFIPHIATIQLNSGSYCISTAYLLNSFRDSFHAVGSGGRVRRRWTARWRRRTGTAEEQGYAARSEETKLQTRFSDGDAKRRRRKEKDDARSELKLEKIDDFRDNDLIICKGTPHGHEE